MKVACFMLYFKASQNNNRSIFRFAILQQQLLSQFVLWNSPLLHATSFAVFWTKLWQNTEVQCVEIGRWRRPQFLDPKPQEIVSAPILGFVGRVRGSTALLEGEIFIFELLVHITQGRGQKIIDVQICTPCTNDFHFTKIREDFQVFWRR